MCKSLDGCKRSFAFVRHCGILLLLSLTNSPLFAQPQKSIDQSVPSLSEVKKLVADEPLSLESWPVWRNRLLAWMDDRTHNADPAYEAARQFALEQGEVNGQLPDKLSSDFVAEYLLGSALLRSGDGRDAKARAARAEKSFRRSLELKEDFARTHRNLALALMIQQQRDDVARQHLRRARELDANLPLEWVEAQAAMLNKNFSLAATKFRSALEEEPDESRYAIGLAQSLLAGSDSEKEWSLKRTEREIAELQERFPDEGVLPCFHSVSLAQIGEFKEAAVQLDRARQLGVDPAEVLGPKAVRQIERLAAPGILEIVKYAAIGFAAVYTVVIIGMALTGLALGRFTRGVNAVGLLGHQAQMIQIGQVMRTQGESMLARLYGLALMGGLIMFYVAVPFVVLGLVGATLGLLYAIFMLPRVPIRLIIIVVIIGLGMAWGVFKSLFAKTGSGGFGLPLDRADEPRLYETIDAVARSVDTQPVNDIYLAPGSDIGVHQEGRGPFGMFGVKNRVLTLGMASLKHLTVDQLRSIMAHEYAHFSHGDTFYSRFIHQVTMSIEQSLMGMASAGGKLNYVNPFYWFMIWYYKAYSLMSAGFSRSREFLADRMAVSLYGRDVFVDGLIAVATEGAVFEENMQEQVFKSFETDHPITNLYQRNPDSLFAASEKSDLEKIRRDILEEKGSAYASHPTIAERFEAVASFPDAPRRDDTPACQLLSDQKKLEEESTQFLTAYFLQLIAYHAAQEE